MPEAVRRSGRSRKVNTKYNNNAWGKETLRLLRESSESSNPTSVESEAASSQSDEEFDEQQQQQVESATAEPDEDNLSVVSASSKSSQIRPQEDLNDDASNNEEETPYRLKYYRPKQSSELHSRGIAGPERTKAVKSGVWQTLFGPGVDDLKPMLLAKEKWLYHVRDTTLPSSKTMQAANLLEPDASVDSNKPRPSNSLHPDHETRQELVSRTLAEMKLRKFLVDGNDHQIVLGPWSKQKIYDIPYMSTVTLDQAWKVLEGSDLSYHSGWFFNVGERPQCMAWSREQNQHQYLALVCRSTLDQRNAVPKPEPTRSPAFSPSAPYPLSIQIWKVSIKHGIGTRLHMDVTAAPQLVQVLGCSFGDIKQIEWAPEAREQPVADSSTQLGMLVLLSTDGCVRFVRVPNVDATPINTTYYEITTPSLKIIPPADSVYSCFTFASPADLVLGTSSGHVLAYNISQSPNLTEQLEPYLVLPLHSTYVMSLRTLDGEFSHFLGSTSAAGVLQLTDLRSPFQDSVVLPRARIPSRNLVCNPHSRCFITTLDSSGNTEPRGSAQTTLVAHNFRHFTTTLSLSKFPEGGGTATALAGSPLHPCVLMGNSGGTVWAQNVIRRIFPTAKRGSKTDGGAWVQKLVEYEWIPRPQPPSSTPAATEHRNSNDPNTNPPSFDLHNGPAVRPGRSRTHHGFKPEKLDLSNQGIKKRKIATGGGLGGDNAVQVVFEEEQAVAAIDWNPNPVAAGWCAIAWGSGVVWVTDLCHETS